MASPPYCPPVLSPARLMRIILLQGLLLEFSCATTGTPSSPDHLFLNVCCVVLQLVKELLVKVYQMKK